MLRIKGDNNERVKMMHKAIMGQSAATGNELAKQLDMPSTRRRKERDWELKRQPEGPTVYLQGTGRYVHEPDHEDDSSSGLSDFEDEGLSALREARLQEMKKQFKANQRFRALGHGVYTEIQQDEFLPTCTSSKYVVCHFYHEEFTRCKIMDRHLGLLAPKHLPTRFVKIDATKAPFFVSKLQIRTLPTVVFFKDGKSVDRLVGFQDLGGDEFPTVSLAARIATAGVLLLDAEYAEAEEDERD